MARDLHLQDQTSLGASMGTRKLPQDLESFFNDTPSFFPSVPKVISETLPLVASTHNDGIRLKMLYDNPLFSDITLVSNDNRSFRAHRLVLASVPYFEGLFRFQGEGSTITFPDIDGASIEMILHILYDVTGVPHDFNDYFTLYVHADRLSSEFLRDLAYRNIRYFIDHDSTEGTSFFRDLIDQQELLFDINLGYRLLRDYLTEGFRETLMDLPDSKFEDVMMKLIPYIARDGIYPQPEGTKGSDDWQDFFIFLCHWLYREFITHEICCNSVRQKVPIYHKIVSTYLTIKPCLPLEIISKQDIEKFLPSKECFTREPYQPDNWHMTLGITPGSGYPINLILAPKLKPRTPCRNIYV